ncbi:MAG: BMP family ABC transporter substrate-binding protein [Armatimonadetes bacterium]|nr:BMP family ABC transporter substrate-binding protein [Armatimonadota bacterium]
MKKWLSLLCCLCLCGPALAQEFRVGAVCTGQFHDGSWNAMLEEGLQALAAEGTIVYRLAGSADADRAIRELAGKSDLVVCHGGEFQDAAVRVAPDFPRVRFLVTGGDLDRPVPNHVTIAPVESAPAAYLMGRWAGLRSKSHQVAYLGGQAMPDLVREADAFRKGAAEVGSRCEIAWADTWTDPVKGRELAARLIEAGSDVLMIDADLTGHGAERIAGERGVAWVGLALPRQGRGDTSSPGALALLDYDMAGVLSVWRSWFGSRQYPPAGTPIPLSLSSGYLRCQTMEAPPFDIAGWAREMALGQRTGDGKPAPFQPLGRWLIHHTDGTPIRVTVRSDGTCASDWAAGEYGVWRFQDDRLFLVWTDGWLDVIQRSGEGFEKRGWGPGIPRDDPPTNLNRAEKTADS